MKNQVADIKGVKGGKKKRWSKMEIENGFTEVHVSQSDTFP